MIRLRKTILWFKALRIARGLKNDLSYRLSPKWVKAELDYQAMLTHFEELGKCFGELRQIKTEFLPYLMLAIVAEGMHTLQEGLNREEIVNKEASQGPGELPNDERKCSGRAPSFSNGLLNCQYVYTDCQYVIPDVSLKKGGVAVRRRFERE